MKVFVLSLLAVSSVYSHAIPYPGFHQLVTYEPSRGQFPVYNELSQGYLHYHDHNGLGHTVSFNYPEPLFGLRRYSYSSNIGANKFLRTADAENDFSAQSYYQPMESNTLEKAREEHFRKWCQHRYDALQAELAKLRAEGVKPSTDMLAQLQPLEKIVTTQTYNDIMETPEFKRIHDEHLRIWNEARLKVLQQESDHLRFHGSKQTTSDSINPSKNDLRETHPVQQLQQNFDLKSTLNLQQTQQQVDDTAEVKRAREEHLHALNEAILRAKAEGTYNANDDGSYKGESNQKISGNIETSSLLKYIPAVQQPIQPVQNIAILHTSQPNQQSQSSILKSIPQLQQPSPVQDTPEVIRARDEHLKIFNEVKLSQPIAENQQQVIQHTQDNLLKSTISQSLEPLPVQDTPEVIRARDEHLKVFNEAKLKAEQHSDTNQNVEKVQILTGLRTHNDKHTETEFVREDQIQIEAERQREAEQELERQREEEKLRKMEILLEEQRQAEEKRLREAEELQLKQEEERRRLEKEQETSQYQQQKLSASSSASYSGSSSFSSASGGLALQAQNNFNPTALKTSIHGLGYEGATATLNAGSTGVSSGTGFVLSSQYQNNPYLLRFAAQPGTTAYIITEPQAGLQQLPTPGVKYLPANLPTTQQTLPLLTQTGLNKAQSIELTGNIGKTNPFLSTGKISSSSSSSSASSSFSSSSSSSNLGLGSHTEAASLAELEKATREHFRAHELALENLRLANEKNPHAKDC